MNGTPSSDMSDHRKTDPGLAMRIKSLCRICMFSAVLSVSVHGAAFSQLLQVSPAAETFTFGKFKFSALRDAQNVVLNDGKVFGTAVGPVAVAVLLKKAGKPTDKLVLDVDALLVRAPGRMMLFDTGVGAGAHGSLVASLASAGMQPSEITEIFITHSHFDHVGGLATGYGRLEFPHAFIYMSAKEWRWMMNDPGNKALASLIAPRVRTFVPGSMVVPDVISVALYGHTPGHVGYEIGSGNDRILDVGDIVHSQIISFAEPDWANGYDDDPKMAAITRRATLTRLAASHEWMFAPHLPFPGIGRVAALGGGFKWQPGLP